jgi:peptide-methionine (S)-S-oxide reductase
VVRTRVGYCGGQKLKPTYHDLGDHTETVQIDFDPKQISYEQILEIFWTQNNHCATPYSRQYMSAVWYQDDQQKKIATETRDREAVRSKAKITTEILPLAKTAFYRAEDYHQKYLLRRNAALLRELQKQFPDPQALVDSTAAARINGYLGGHVKPGQLDKEIDSLGLSESGRNTLRRLIETDR